MIAYGKTKSDHFNLMIISFGFLCSNHERMGHLKCDHIKQFCSFHSMLKLFAQSQITFVPGALSSKRSICRSQNSIKILKLSISFGLEYLISLKLSALSAIKSVNKFYCFNEMVMWPEGTQM